MSSEEQQGSMEEAVADPGEDGGQQTQPAGEREGVEQETVGSEVTTAEEGQKEGGGDGIDEGEGEGEGTREGQKGDDESTAERNDGTTGDVVEEGTPVKPSEVSVERGVVMV